ncbi:MAG TPA: imelysin family protein [Pseudomonadales bacterium]|nr:imelysin family protein [Pseudomonadales bacterium]
MIKYLARFSLLLLLCGCTAENTVSDEEKYAVVTHYADLAHVIFKDARITAEAMEQRTEALLNSPDDTHLQLARKAWLEARKPYLQTEVFRLGNPRFDTYHHRVNGWPTSAQTVEETLRRNSEFTVTSLPNLVPANGDKNTVLTGFHVIEALLWGSGDRPVTDFMANHYCTSENKPASADTCEHRRQYLIAATKLLVEDLNALEKQWSADERGNYRSEFLRQKLPDAYGYIFSGMTSLLLGQLAGPQLKVPFNTKSLAFAEDNGSANYHNTLEYSVEGIRNVYYGHYTAIDDTRYNGTSLKALLTRLNPALQQRLSNAFKNLDSSLGAIHQAVETNHQPFAQLIATETPERMPNLQANQLIRDAIDALVLQAHLIEQAAPLFGANPLTTHTAGFTF